MTWEDVPIWAYGCMILGLGWIIYIGFYQTYLSLKAQGQIR